MRGGKVGVAVEGLREQGGHSRAGRAEQSGRAKEKSPREQGVCGERWEERRAAWL
jgi:hypothetical protein